MSKHVRKNPMGTRTYAKYPKGSTFDGKRVLNLGCGYTVYNAPNVVNLDAFDCCKPDVVWDLSKTPLPFKDEEFDLIIANHILEHVPNWWDCFNDCCRIIKKGGIIDVWVPAAGGDSQLGFRDHLNVINHCSWWGTMGLMSNDTNAWCTANKFEHASKVRVIEQNIIIDADKCPSWFPQSVKFWMANHLRNIGMEINFKFVRER